MKRDTLAAFFRRAVVAALPLLGACDSNQCGGSWTVDGGVADIGCGWHCQLPGGRSTVFCEDSTNQSGGVITVCHTDCTGRRPSGLARATFTGSTLGRHFARMAHLEAASVPAFRRLRAELRRHGAPRRLLDACSRAAADEMRHVRATTRLARRFGGRVARVSLAPFESRALIDLAVENVREGCVRESFGALILTWQARAARDREVRSVLETLATDETRHAELAWAINDWLQTRLSPAQATVLERARREELAAIGEQIESAPDRELVDTVGMPSPRVARSLHRAFSRLPRRG
jgi:hypothetical protein